MNKINSYRWFCVFKGFFYGTFAYGALCLIQYAIKDNWYSVAHQLLNMFISSIGIWIATAHANWIEEEISKMIEQE